MQIKVSKKSEDAKITSTKLPEPTSTSVFRQLIAGCSANLTLINAGLQFGWPAVSLPDLEDEKATVRVSSSEGAWIVCALSMGACLGPVISAVLVNNIGRKWTLLATVLPNIACWTLVYFARSPEMLFVARFIGGIGLGATFATVPMYIGEIAETRMRGALGCMLCIMVGTGNLMTYIVGPWLSIPMLAVVDVVPSLLFAATFVWMPETPYYHLSRGEYRQAERSLIWLRGRQEVTHELQEMLNLTRKEERYRGGIGELLTIRGNRWATLIAFVAIGAQQMSGLFAIFAYSGLIFEGTTRSVNPEILVGTCGMVSLVFNVLTFFVIDRIGRKPLLLVSSLGTIVCLVLIGTHFHTRPIHAIAQTNVNGDEDTIFWLPIVSLMAFYAFYAIGLGPIPYALVSEIYPISVKAWATMVVSIYGSLLSVAVSKIYQIVADRWGEHVIFWSFAIMETLFAILVGLVVFETKGKSFEEIQSRLNGNGNPRKRKLKNLPDYDHRIKPFFIHSEENLAIPY